MFEGNQIFEEMAANYQLCARIGHFVELGFSNPSTELWGLYGLCNEYKQKTGQLPTSVQTVYDLNQSTARVIRPLGDFTMWNHYRRIAPPREIELALLDLALTAVHRLTGFDIAERVLKPELDRGELKAGAHGLAVPSHFTHIEKVFNLFLNHDQDLMSVNSQLRDSKESFLVLFNQVYRALSMWDALENMKTDNEMFGDYVRIENQIYGWQRRVYLYTLQIVSLLAGPNDTYAGVSIKGNIQFRYSKGATWLLAMLAADTHANWCGDDYEAIARIYNERKSVVGILKA